MKRIYLSKIVLLIALLSGLSWGVNAQTSTYTTAGTYTYTVPPALAVSVDMAAAQGGNGCNSSSYPGGKGGRVQCVLAVSTGQVLTIVVGGQNSTFSTGGAPGGGNGYSGEGGGGGGYSAVILGTSGISATNALAVAGGGGGGDCEWGDWGGAGGNLIGGSGYYGCGGTCGSYSSIYCGSGGNTTAGTGGLAGTDNSGSTAGGFLTGGGGTSCCYGGGGGAGWYGGGGGSFGSGGGGSSYTNATYASGVAYTQGYQPGAGYVDITALSPAVTASPSSISFTPALVGALSVPPSYTTLSGLYMFATGTITASVPGGSGFLISTNGINWGTSVTLTANAATNGYVTPTFGPPGNPATGVNIYVSFTPASLGPNTANLNISGTNITSFNVPLSGNGVAACTGMPTAGSSAVNGTIGSGTGGTYSPFTLSLTGGSTASTGGLSFQWLSSTTGGAPWTAIPGAVLPTYSFTGVSTTTYYECSVSCLSSGLSNTSTESEIIYQGGVTPTSCTAPTDASGFGQNITVATAAFPFIVTNSTSGNMDDGTVYTVATPRYVDQSGTYTCYESAGSTQTGVSIGGANNVIMSCQMWVDFNNNGTFETSESVGGQASISIATGYAHPAITIPAGIPPGAYRFRVEVGFNNGSNTGEYLTYPNMNPCTSSTNAYYAETRDYTMVIVPAYCSGTPVAGIAAVTPSSACSAPYTPTFFNIGEATLTGISYNWQYSTVSSSGPWNFSGSTGTVYTPNVASLLTGTTGTLWVRNSATCAYTGSNPTGYSAYDSVVLNAPPTPITGPNIMCTGVSQNLTSTPLGGTWTSNNTSIATAAGTVSSAITGVAVGMDTIKYTLSTGCYASYPITVNTQPSPITGPNTICQSSTGSYSDITPSGTWTSSTLGVATISASGLASAIASGTTNLSYTSPSGCITSRTVTVNPLPTLYIVSPANGSYCSGSSSTTAVTLSGSTPGISYQLLLGGVPVGPAIIGTGFGLNFGIQSSAGTYTVVATNTSTTCTRTMVGQTIISINPLPILETVSETGGGSYCAGSTGSAPHVTITNSQTGVTYDLYRNGLSPANYMGTGYNRAGATGSALDFAPDTLNGIYYVVAVANGTGCTATMTGSAAVAINLLPVAELVTSPGSSSYCIGGAGVDILLEPSISGISYTLMNGSSIVSTLAGTGSNLSFGDQTVAGSYTIVGTNVSTGCTNTMDGIVTVSVNAPPNGYPVFTYPAGLSTGSFCAGGSGIDIQVYGSDPGATYQLYNGAIPVGTAVTGTGLNVDMGPQTGAGTYSVIATSTSGCTGTMTGTVTVSVNPAPAIETVTGGGNFCTGGSGVHIGLNPSTSGVNYQLFMGTTPLSTLSGTGGALNYGIFTTLGAYTVVATNAVTSCTDTMAGTAIIATNPLPASFNVTGSGNYCSGGSGVPVGLDFSSTGITYQLYRSGVAVGVPVTGTGSSISFGYQTVSGTYTAVGTNVSTGCVGNMAGSAVIGVNPLPNAHVVTGGGNFCISDSGVHVGLNGSDAGIMYQLYQGLTPVGSSMTGTGGILDFGLQTLGGTYTVLATNTTNGCTRYMSGGAPVNVNPLPGQYLVTGGGVYCSGGPGVHIGLSGSATGIKYQLLNSGAPIGSPITGTGASVDFGLQTYGGSYTVIATNASTGCNNSMLSSVTVATNPLPTVYTVTGGGGYCAGGTGSPISLSGSDVSVTYQLYHGAAMVGAPMTGTGSAVDFGLQTAVGSYTVLALNPTTGCTSNMASDASVSINPLPGAFPVTGGGNYCAGGTGFHIYVAGSTSGVSYQLSNGSSPVVSMPGTGSDVDFGIQTAAGIYTVAATNTATGCTNNMTDSATINVNPLPVLHNVTGGGSYCAGGTGVAIGIDTSTYGTNYQLYLGASPVGAPAAGTGLNLNFGMHTAPGSYTVVAIVPATTCSANMTGSATVAVLPLPTVFGVTGGGNYCATGAGATIGLNGTQVNVNYQLWQGTTPVGFPVPGTGSSISFGPQTVAGSYAVTATDATPAACIANMSGSVSVNMLPIVLPGVALTSSVTGIACIGQTVNFTASPINGGTSPTFQWLVNGTSMGVGTSFSYMPVNGDVVAAMITSNAQCAIPDTGSGSMVMTVSPPEMPSASVSVNPGPQVCTGGTASFTASVLYGGTSPTYTWVKNGAFVSTGTTTYSYMPDNGDIVSFMLGSNFPCRLADTVFSNNTDMQVEPAVLPVVNISSNPGTSVAPGESVTFTANISNAVTSPTYQWVVNSAVVPGANSKTYTTSTLNNDDSVTCQVGGSCGLVGFNSVEVHVQGSGTGVVQVSGANGNVVLVPNPNKGDFILKGNLSSAADQELSIEVTNMIGQVIYTDKVTAPSGTVNEHIVLNNLANGMYLLNMNSATGNTVFHFVIEQ